jgi:hypothetical protein
MILFPLITYWMSIQVFAASLPASPSENISRRERSRRYVTGGWR